MGSGHDAIVESSLEPAYLGAPGKTRRIPIHVVGPNGSAETHKVYRVVNVGTDPELRQQAIEGDLHVLPDGRRLLLPFVYHDPDERKFALVVPGELAHLELKEWATLMAELAEDTSVHLPRYVREAATVVGFAALASFVEDAEEPDDSELSEAVDAAMDTVMADGTDDALIREREQQVIEQERGLSRMAESLTTREADLLRREEQLRTAQVDLELREQEMRERINRLMHEAQVLPPDGPEAEWQEVRSATEVGNEDATVVKSVESIRAEQELSAAHVSVPPPLLAARPGGPPPLRPHHEEDEENADEAVNEVSDAEVEAVSDRPSTAPAAKRPDVDPPRDFHEDAAPSMRQRYVDEELWLFVALDRARLARLGKAPELLLQCVLEEGYPVVVLSLLGAREDGAVARQVLDGHTKEARQLLATLENTYRARVALYVDGSYRESLTLSSLREGVARAALALIDEAPQESAKVEARVAVQKVAEKPPALDTDDLPFGPARRPMSTTASVLQAVEQLQSWLRPSRLREAMLVYSVPRHVIEASARRVLRAAMSYGIALSDDAESAAIEYGVVASRAQLLCNQLVAFRMRVQHGDNDLSLEATAENWEQLFSRADKNGVEIDQDLRAFARPSAPPAPSTSAPAADSRIFESRSTDELQAMLGKPNERAQAFRELCVRKHAPALPGLLTSLRAMAPQDAATAAAHLLHFGDALADPLGKQLTTDNAHLRHAAALLVGYLKQRRNLVPLIKQLDEEPSPSWQEMARALGHFGAPGLRTLVRSLDRARHSDRFVVAMGHLANHGCAKEVETMENDESKELAKTARQAMARRSRLQWEDLAIREQRTLVENTPAARFSQAFYAEAAKLDI